MGAKCKFHWCTVVPHMYDSQLLYGITGLITEQRFGSRSISKVWKFHCSYRTDGTAGLQPKNSYRSFKIFEKFTIQIYSPVERHQCSKISGLKMGLKQADSKIAQTSDFFLIHLLSSREQHKIPRICITNLTYYITRLFVDCQCWRTLWDMPWSNDGGNK
jgi:hypothetical protein